MDVVEGVINEEWREVVRRGRGRGGMGGESSGDGLERGEDGRGMIDVGERVGIERMGGEKMILRMNQRCGESTLKISNLDIYTIQRQCSSFLNTDDILEIRKNKKTNSFTMEITQTSTRTKKTVEDILKEGEITRPFGNGVDISLSKNKQKMETKKIIYLPPEVKNLEEVKKDINKKNDLMVTDMVRFGQTFAVLLKIKQTTTGKMCEKIKTLLGEKTLIEYKPKPTTEKNTKENTHESNESNGENIGKNNTGSRSEDSNE